MGKTGVPFWIAIIGVFITIIVLDITLSKYAWWWTIAGIIILLSLIFLLIKSFSKPNDGNGDGT